MIQTALDVPDRGLPCFTAAVNLARELGEESFEKAHLGSRLDGQYVSPGLDLLLGAGVEPFQHEFSLVFVHYDSVLLGAYINKL